ncbi:phosphoglycerate kinase, chloroplastic isoform X7 [Vigna angularis]|uniref:phosphoglycerate kinase, chloroplastic isoform X7 n=1 Tax=Phaseolus angularis TaxID=3914 RepID=UPI0022B54A7E|nr:phosphoglycerate kinase, chloroplastic isoform X7 [Vigna angularis]
MMGHPVNLLHGTVLSNKLYFSDFPKLFKQIRYAHTGKFAKFLEFNGAPLPLQGCLKDFLFFEICYLFSVTVLYLELVLTGSGDITNHVANLFNHKIYFSNGGKLNGIPHIQTLREFPREELFGKVVMVRFDSNILVKRECDKKNESDSNAVYTIKYLHKAGANVILVSDWNMNIPELHTDSVTDFLSEVLQIQIVPLHAMNFKKQAKMNSHEKENIHLLENLSNFKEEVANSLEFSRILSSGVDIFVNDSFSNCHKVLASTVGVTRFCYACIAGFHFEERLDQLKNLAEASTKPYVAIIGGGNLYDKAASFQFLASRCQVFVFVGMMSFQVMHALGVSIPCDLVDHQAVNEALDIVRLAQDRNVQLLYPKDFWCQKKSDPKQLQLFPSHGILDDWVPVDLGPVSLDEIDSTLRTCKGYPFEINWRSIYSDPTQSLVVDIGSGNGLFLLEMARRRQDLNFLGLEINEKHVLRCQDSIHQYGIKNGYFVATNATSTFRSIVSAYPGQLVLVSIQCPNPDFNKPEHRWRMLQRSLIEAVVDLLAPNGKIYLQSDVEAVAIRMKEQFLRYGKSKLDLEYGQSEWLEENPFGVRSDWEKHVLERQAPMYRMMFSKSSGT